MGDVHTDRPKHADNQPVSYDSGVNLISNEDIFRLLKKRHDHRWASYKGCGNEIYEGIFYETICLLENLERQLGLVYNRAYPTRDDFLIALEHGDQQRLNQIIKFYEELRVERDLIKYAQQTHFFSKNVQAYIAYLKRYPDSHFWKKGDEWQVKTFPHEALFDFFEIYLGRLHVGQTEPTTSTMGLVIENPSESDEISQQQKLAESENIEKTDRVAVAPLTETLTQDVYKQFDEGLRQFNEFLARHKSLRVMCFEITLTPQEATFGEKWRALDRKRNELSGCFNLLIERYGLLAKYSRIEMGINSSLNERKRRSAWKIAKAVGELWEDVTGDDGSYFNCHDRRYLKQYEEQGTLGVGIIYSEVDYQVRKMCSTLSYLARPEKEQYLRVKTSRRMRTFGMSQR